MKLIKLTDGHYIIVDDSDVRPNDFVYSYITNNIVRFTDPRHFSDNTYKKITHSTRALEPIDGRYIYNKIQPLSIQEIEELILQVDVEKKVYALCQSESIVDDYGKATNDGMIIGVRAYNQALADNKDKKYTEEDVIYIIDNISQNWFKCYSEKDKKEHLLNITKELQKTQWEVEIVKGFTNDTGKLKLK